MTMRVAADDIGGGAGIVGQGIQGGGIGTQLGSALEAVVGIAEAGFRAEVGARGHAWRKVAR